MFTEIYSSTIVGLNACTVSVETDVGPGLPCFEMSGFLANEVKEAKERVKIAIKNSDFKIKPQRIIINLSPADLRKTGTGFDLPVAVGILTANEYIHSSILKETIFVGELSLDGKVNPVRGCLVSAIEARKNGFKTIVVPAANKKECMCIDGIRIVGVSDLRETVAFLNGGKDPGEGEEPVADNATEKVKESIDYSDIKGQMSAKLATVIAVAGMHNILYIGPPGCGKSMMSKRIPTIMPGLTKNEELELTKIYSVSGKLSPEDGLVKQRPFRSPSHTVSKSALLGGGSNPSPGEITLASKGVLFLDELTQFNSSVIEALRQPLEDKKIMISRVKYAVDYPADFMLAAAMNPCKCGYYPDRKKCSCDAADIHRYIGKLSKPIIDRFDLCIYMEQIKFSDMFGDKVERALDSDTMKKDVLKAVEVQAERFKNSSINFNSEMNHNQIKKYCKTDAKAEKMIEMIFEKENLTARGIDKILKTARTIADMDGHEMINERDIAQASMFRVNLEGGAWGG